MTPELLPLAVIGLDRLRREFVLRSALSGSVTDFCVVGGRNKVPEAPDWQSDRQACPPALSLEDPVHLGVRLASGETRWATSTAKHIEDCTPNRLSISKIVFDPLRRQLQVSGWLATALPRYRVELHGGGLRLGTLRAKAPRPDVQAVNSFLPRGSGFAGEIEVPDPLIPDLIAGTAGFELRMIGPNGVAGLRGLELSPLPEAERMLAEAELSRRIAQKIADAPRPRLERLLASEAFRRRWAAAVPGHAWVAREQIVAQLIPLLHPGDEIAVRLRNGDLILCQPVEDSILARKFLIEAGDEIGFLDWLAGQIDTGDRVIDIGAAYGMVSRAMARAGAHVTAVEADPTSARRIRRMGLSFDAGRIDLIEKAIAETSGEIVFAGMGASCVGSGKILENDAPETIDAFLDEVSQLRQMPLSAQARPGHYDHRSFTRADVSIRKIPATSIDDICRERGLRDIKLMKIDIEGGELLALRGARGLIGGDFGKPPVIVFEYSRLFPMRGGRHEEILELFYSRGWSLFVLAGGKTKGGALTPIPDADHAPAHDNLIAVPPHDPRRPD